MAVQSVVLLYDEAVATGPDGLPDLGLALLEWVRIGSVTAVRVERAEFDTTLRLMAGYVSDSELPAEARRMPPNHGPWRWDCYDECFEFAGGVNWPPEALPAAPDA